MKKINLIIALLITLSFNLYPDEIPNKLTISKYKVIKTTFKNFNNDVHVATITEFDNNGNITNHKYKYSCGKINDTYETKYNYNKKNIFLTILENNEKIEEQRISVDDDGKFIEIITTYHKNNMNYKTIKYLYKNKNLKSIKYSNIADKNKYDIEYFFYEKNRIIKIMHDGSDYKGSVKLYEYNKHDKMSKETWLFDNKIVRVINYNYDLLLNLSNKTYEMFIDDKKINGRVEYYYNNDGDLIKEISYIKDKLESEKNYVYE